VFLAVKLHCDYFFALLELRFFLTRDGTVFLNSAACAFHATGSSAEASPNTFTHASA